jgi:hypothetical protein
MAEMLEDMRAKVREQTRQPFQQNHGFDSSCLLEGALDFVCVFSVSLTCLALKALAKSKRPFAELGCIILGFSCVCTARLLGLLGTIYAETPSHIRVLAYSFATETIVLQSRRCVPLLTLWWMLPCRL